MNLFLDQQETPTRAAAPAVEPAAPVTTEQPDQPTLTKSQITAAATNSPALALEGFNFGGRDFKLLDLSYDSYLDFTFFLQPLLEGIASKFLAAKGVSLPGIEIPELEGPNVASYFLKFCRQHLPQMVCIVCNQQALQDGTPEAEVTPEWVKAHAKSPFQLAKIVMMQVGKNQMISEFADFFAQILPIVTQMTSRKTS
jgi:hypothetical protein